MALCLVTGAAGFVGNNLARGLLAAGHRVRGIDNFATGHRRNIEDISELDFREGDIAAHRDINEAMDSVEYVFHQAAIPSVPRSVDDPLRSHHANVTGTLMVLEAARQAGSVKRVVYAASSSAYGNTPVLPKVESMVPRPLSPYAVNKLTGEYYAQVYARVYGLETVSLRYFNVFGPRQDPMGAYAAVIPKFIECVLRDESPPIHGDGEQTRDFSYIDNVVAANLLACTAPNVSGEVFNIACGDRISLLDLLGEINRVLNKNVPPQHMPPRPGDVRDSLADIGRAKQMLGYEPKVSWREGLARSIEWYRGSAGL